VLLADALRSRFDDGCLDLLILARDAECFLEKFFLHCPRETQLALKLKVLLDKLLQNLLLLDSRVSSLKSCVQVFQCID
jgi:hypothetical protein